MSNNDYILTNDDGQVNFDKLFSELQDEVNKRKQNMVDVEFIFQSYIQGRKPIRSVIMTDLAESILLSSAELSE